MKAEISGFDYMLLDRCEQMIKPFAPFSDLVKSPKFFPFAREMLGFAMHGPLNQLHEYEEYIGKKGKVNIDCADLNLTVEAGIDEYTDQDKDILADSNHCLNDLYQIYEKISENYP